MEDYLPVVLDDVVDVCHVIRVKVGYCGNALALNVSVTDHAVKQDGAVATARAWYADISAPVTRPYVSSAMREFTYWESVIWLLFVSRFSAVNESSSIRIMIMRPLTLIPWISPPSMVDNDRGLQAVEAVLREDDPLVQLAALDLMGGLPPEERVDLAQRFLTHPLRALRLAAAQALTESRGHLSDRRRGDLDAAMEEYWAAQRFNADRAEGLFNSGSTLARLGRMEEAADGAGNRDRTGTLVHRGLCQPGGLDAPFGTGRTGGGAAASGHREQQRGFQRTLRPGIVAGAVGAADRSPGHPPAGCRSGPSDEPYYQYVIGIALNSTGERERALERLRQAHARFPGYRDVLVALATIHRDARESPTRPACYAERLLELSPADAAARALLEELNAD